MIWLKDYWKRFNRLTSIMHLCLDLCNLGFLWNINLLVSKSSKCGNFNIKPIGSVSSDLPDSYKYFMI